MTSEWERLKARMVKVVEREASELEVEHGWTRKLVSVGGWPHKYIYSYYNDKGYLSPLSTGEWKYTPKNEDVSERQIDQLLHHCSLLVYIHLSH